MTTNNAENQEFRELLVKIDRRLEDLESRIEPRAASVVAVKAAHVSQERFKSLEAIADAIIEELSGGEKPCPYEPTAKPCDNCAMCNSRGF